MAANTIVGKRHIDERGVLTYNNDFDATAIKRIYFIENRDNQFERAWQGHKIEQRWFSAVKGSFVVKVIKIDNWEAPTVSLEHESFTLSSDCFLVLHIPQGYVSSIQSLEEDSKLMIMSDYAMGELKDEFRYDSAYFS